MGDDDIPAATSDDFDVKPIIPIRKVNYKLKAKNRARRKEANRQNKRRRHAA